MEKSEGEKGGREESHGEKKWRGSEILPPNSRQTHLCKLSHAQQHVQFTSKSVNKQNSPQSVFLHDSPITLSHTHIVHCCPVQRQIQEHFQRRGRNDEIMCKRDPLLPLLTWLEMQIHPIFLSNNDRGRDINKIKQNMEMHSKFLNNIKSLIASQVQLNLSKARV